MRHAERPACTASGCRNDAIPGRSPTSPGSRCRSGKALTRTAMHRSTGLRRCGRGDTARPAVPARSHTRPSSRDRSSPIPPASPVPAVPTCRLSAERRRDRTDGAHPPIGAVRAHARLLNVDDVRPDLLHHVVARGRGAAARPAKTPRRRCRRSAQGPWRSPALSGGGYSAKCRACRRSCC